MKLTAKIFLLPVLFFLTLLSCQTASADRDWFISLYRGQCSNNNLGNILSGKTDLVNSHIMTFAIGKELWTYKNCLSIEVEGQFAKKWGYEVFSDDDYAGSSSGNPGWDWKDGYSYESQNSGYNRHEEFNAAFVLRWRKFPWNKTIMTTFGVGDGISYATEKPPVEKDPHGVLHGEEHSRWETAQTLNYLLFDITFALPKAPEYSLFFRIHHRSGIFGLVNGIDRGGTNFLCVGIRCQFDLHEVAKKQQNT